MRRSARITGGTVLILLCLAFGIWYAALREDRRGLLAVSFLDVGQGDAIFIDAPSGRQVLIDGGRDAGVLRRLAEVLPWWDRTLDVVVGTHPDADHIGGLIDVLPRYTVGMIVESGVLGDTATWGAFEKEVAEEGARLVTARRGQVLDLGRGAYLEILSPDRAVPHVDTNDGCIVARLVYGTTAFMLPCDAPKGVEDYLVRLDGSTSFDTAQDKSLTTSGSGLKADVLKAGHHGSKTSSDPLFVGFVSPAFGVFSRGCENSYGHPAPETVAAFEKFGIPVLDTCTNGTVTFVSDGRTVRRK